MRLRKLASLGIALAIAAAASAASAQELELHGWVDARLVGVSADPSWTRGGLGKLRFDGHGGGIETGGAALLASWTPAPAWLALASAQVQDTGRGGADVTEAWLRYRPVSTTPWRWSLRGGLFFPTVSLENDALGWTSPHTLTPSAINSWIGEEVRSIGAELRVERRGPRSTLEGALALFGGNDPAGELMAVRGWSLSDLVYGLGSSIRTPDLSAHDAPPPRHFDPFVEMDDRIGWHGEVSWHAAGRARLTLMRYDNRADPSAEMHFEGHEIYAWRTRFWSVGAQASGHGLVWMAQAMVGDTEIRPSPSFRTDTGFWSAYLLAAREHGEWRPALRLDLFGTRQGPETLDEPANEHGRALTVALNWRPRPRLRVALELIHLRGARTERPRAGLPERFADTQLQLALRAFF